MRKHNSKRSKKTKTTVVAQIRPKPSKLTMAKRQENFLKQFAITGTISSAALACGINRELHYTWINDDPTYPDRFKAALQEVNDSLEAEIIRRGRDGIDKNVYYQGQCVDTIKEYSDTLLIFLTKGFMPDKYREQIDVRGQHVHVHAVRPVGAESLDDGSISRVIEAIARPAGGSRVVVEVPQGGADPA